MVEKGLVAVFWELAQTQAINDDPREVIGAIQDLTRAYGEIKNLTAYTPYDPTSKFHITVMQRPLYNRLASLDYEVRFCPQDGHQRPTIGHSIVADIAFYCALEHPETTTIVFITGDRDFTYLASALRKQGIQIVILMAKEPALRCGSLR
ncbi:hypothetical protein DFP72DRAFT_1177121 [Ephemerocybe angulata]|uniref:NYN domain-containing protein n=1 Tax=Ephemerocybe angulata TaxID=980116 RepID=A0A8H6LW13_9AGAR|nr:hypothetical protein DFP72DRAFT_1177121 [Tulosesus angulatus]